MKSKLVKESDTCERLSAPYNDEEQLPPRVRPYGVGWLVLACLLLLGQICLPLLFD